MHISRSLGQIAHYRFSDIVSLLHPGDLLVINNAKVRKVRFRGQSAKGEHEIVFASLPDSEGKVVAIASKRKRLKPGDTIELPQELKISYIEPLGDSALFHVHGPMDESYFAQYGIMPIPPYLKREAETIDEERYQTVFAQKMGAAAAPTASLHFTSQLMDTLTKKGILFCPVTLYVGLGTFAPVRQQNLLEHRMHHETFEISRQSLDLLTNQHKQKGRIIPVGTTAMRLIESLARTPLLPANNVDKLRHLPPQGEMGIFFERKLFNNIESSVHHEPSLPLRGQITWSHQKNSIQGSTSLFITPGFEFQLSAGLITNFHTPKSTLVMLVSAFYERPKILEAYNLARQNGYRFFSYGDAMFIE